ncbi:hypothetical protein OF83DRAFT_660871 [Amylostereum chailletii]|nr:hypothetical protein OF83DRAFT_660871 [Amylostereum chailletii]
MHLTLHRGLRMGIFPARVFKFYRTGRTNEKDRSEGAVWDTSTTNHGREGSGRLPSMGDEAHWVEADVVVRAYRTDKDHGLADPDAEARLLQFGENVIDGKGGVSAFRVLVRQMANALTLVLVAAMAIGFGVRDWIEGGVISAVILLNISLGFFQEYKAEKTIDSLRSLASPTALVVRGGERKQILAKEIVPGDIVHVKTGDVVPADVRLIAASNLEVDEALLTGEAMPVAKIVEPLTTPAKSATVRTVSGDTLSSSTAMSVSTESEGTEVGPREQIAVGDRINLVYASTTVTRGRGHGVVVAVGMNTQIGRIAASMKGKRSEKDRKITLWKRGYESAATLLGLRTGTPLQIKLNRLAYSLFLVAAVLLVVVFAVAKFEVTNEVAIYAIALAIGVIPESLIAVLTVVMSTGTARMAKCNVVVRQLHALEALGSITDICSDKTGTLTAGKMLVRKFWIPELSFSKAPDGAGEASGVYVVETGDSVLEPSGAVFKELKHGVPFDVGKHDRTREFALCASLCNVATIERNKAGHWVSTGDPTEVALQVFAAKVGFGRTKLTGAQISNDLDKLKDAEEPIGRFVLKKEFPFDSDVKRMSTVYIDREAKGEERVVVFLKGAVERVLDTCTHTYMGTSEPVTLSHAMREKIHDQTEHLAAQGLRVLALASRRPRGDLNVHGELKREEVERDHCFIGLAGIYDPPRPESAPAVRACKEAGIVVHMLTGDHQATATAIARDIGIINQYSPASAVMPASQFNKMTDQEIDELPELPLVIARCDPNTKVRMIDAGKRRGKYMAMTGDGVNDAPSLKLAPVGIGMGQGSDVAKNASELVLTDDNFDSIRAAIGEGRRIFDNIQRFILHMLATNVAEVILLTLGLAFQDTREESVFPLSPLAILWLNMITGGFPSVGLGLEPAAVGVMSRPPHDIRAGVFTRYVITDFFVYGVAMGATTLLNFVIVVWGGEHGQLGVDCNEDGGIRCSAVFRARSTVFATLTFEMLLYAWELKSLDRSLFSIRPDRPSYVDIWENQVLFWAVTLGMASVPLAIYIPGLNDEVFFQEGISWEWGLVVGMTVVFVSWVELWKALVARKRTGKMRERMVGGKETV